MQGSLAHFIFVSLNVNPEQFCPVYYVHCNINRQLQTTAVCIRNKGAIVAVNIRSRTHTP